MSHRNVDASRGRGAGRCSACWRPAARGQTCRGSPAPSFTLTAKADRISTPEGGSFLFWGFAAGAGRPQYPGPTLIVNQGEPVSITVANPTGLGARAARVAGVPGQSA